MENIKISNKNESTSFPYWIIIDPKQNFSKGDYGIRNVANMITGVFFSRESAQKHLESNPNNYSKNAMVYCKSGCKSEEWTELSEQITEKKYKQMYNKELTQLNQLRRGNYINYIADETSYYIGKIKNICNDKVVTHNNKVVKSRNIFPISLTNKILDNTNLEKVVNEFDVIEYKFPNSRFVLTQTTNNNIWSITMFDFDGDEFLLRNWITNINNLHELQNIYYVIMHSELEINLIH